MGSLKAKQDDLRRLMKERRENLRDKKNRVDSPFAKYNHLGQLFCIICNMQIKSNGLWTSHVAGKIHKENALKKKKSPADIVQNAVTHLSEKRSEDQPPPDKKMKLSEDEPHVSKSQHYAITTTGTVSSLGEYPLSESEDESEPMDVSNNTPNNVLPTDFFDAAPTSSVFMNQEPFKTEEKKPISEPVNSVEALPEGFFDDPVQDAKARNIEYKDPKEEEWERYQKAIAEETNVSKTIIEEDLEESTLERGITEIDLQINLWEKSKTLQTRAEEASSKLPSNKENDGSSSSTDDELDEDDLLDWRSKGVRKR